jgi:hypothetical protein
MPSHDNPLFTTISIARETKERLDRIGRKGQTYNEIIIDLLNGHVHIPLKERHAKATKKAKRIIGTAATAAGRILR